MQHLIFKVRYPQVLHLPQSIMFYLPNLTLDAFLQQTLKIWLRYRVDTAAPVQLHRCSAASADTLS